jgi:diguanylate cyclase (GGDEF)-like protein/PAS domain S-box-containing protein
MLQHLRGPRSEQSLAKVIEALPWALYVLDESLRLRLWNRQLSELTGYSDDELAEMMPLEFFEAGERPRIAERVVEAFASGSADLDAEVVLKDGRRVPFYFTGSIIDFDGDPCLVGMAIDSSERKRAEAALRRSEALFRAISENARDLTSIIAPDGVLLYNSAVVRDVLGYEPEELVGRNVLELVHPHDAVRASEMLRAALQGAPGGSGTDLRLHRKDGSVRVLSIIANNCVAELGGLLASSRDITEQSSAEDQIRQLAHYDSLTGLPNRNLLLERVEEAIRLAENEDRRGALLFIDLDRFKAINDSLGHAYGDHLLRVAADRLKACLRATDMVSRHGGDEFVVLLPDIRSRSDAERTAAQIRQRLAEPFVIDRHELHASCSIGICVYPADGRDVDTLIRHADIAMYEAKNAGGDAHRSFTVEMNARVLAEVEVEHDLRHALKYGEFELNYQPVFSLVTGEVTSFEALLRWNHPQRGTVMPGDFIRIAEDTGLIEPIGSWVLGEACRQLRLWHDAGFTHLGMAVNLSAKQFRRGTLAQNVRAVLEENRVPPEKLELEITESVIMDQAEQGIATLEALSDLGVKIAVDDFGTGYSSLAYIKRFPIDRLKVDRAFVRDVTTDRDDAAIVSAIVALGRAVEVSVLAEGVETFDQLTHLRELGCEHVQGFLFSRPVPADRALDMLRGLRDGDLHPEPGSIPSGFRNEEAWNVA